jgi:uncharacterized protein with GYD domain
MNTFLLQARYSTGAWARMLRVRDDRTGALRTLVESLGGSLERMFWDVENCTGFAIAEFPDSVSAAALITAVTGTGSFTAVGAHELLTQEQMYDALTMARSAYPGYRAPGSAAIDPDVAVG